MDQLCGTPALECWTLLVLFDMLRFSLERIFSLRSSLHKAVKAAEHNSNS
jgi:hypothetical protein